MCILINMTGDAGCIVLLLDWSTPESHVILIHEHDRGFYCLSISASHLWGTIVRSLFCHQDAVWQRIPHIHMSSAGSPSQACACCTVAVIWWESSSCGLEIHKVDFHIHVAVHLSF